METFHRPNMENPIRSVKTIHQSHSPLANGSGPLRLYIGIVAKMFIHCSEKPSTPPGSPEKRSAEPLRPSVKPQTSPIATIPGYKDPNANRIIA